ncbi:lipid-A-disaccharide synthase [Aestuariivita sp.]|jgi:lipid-A-disaccharide synthase|uniref:lipid-A-disaccharide synthase n=1 Tax=Aestuariivita sp. TaxID=1872407 RepID=UPI00216EA639|nr:lipid-A-disaccharide synthase [Aestuariivita sp.]MCE8006474.1 lipid-A-disaccharide synthase [Aestuariivita sp.]
MRVFILAGEPSGDRLGGALMAGLRHLVPEVGFEGVGGTEMAAQGLESLFPMEELSVMGLAEILPKYAHLKRRIRQTAEAALTAQPDVMITIDSPDFSLRVAKLVKARSEIRTVHYVAPTVWAWRPGRAQKMARVIDQVLALFPFEPPYMEAAGMRSDFVGHPVVAEPEPTQADATRFRDAYDLGKRPILLVLPGSRRGEVGRLAQPFGAALRLFLRNGPDWQVVIPAAGPVADLVKDVTQDWPGAPIILDPREEQPEQAAMSKRGAFAAANLALAASGTVSLELAAARTPMVIAYRFNTLTWILIKRMMRIDTVTLVNLVSSSRVVPECLGPDCRGDLIAKTLQRTYDDPGTQERAMALTMERLGQGGEPPGLRAARAVLDGLQAST